MLVIRNEQLAALWARLLDTLVERALEVARRHWQVRIARMGEPEARSLIRGALIESYSYGMRQQDQGLRYVNVALALGNDFSTRLPWARRILSNSRLAPATRLDLLVARTSDFLNGFEVDGE